MSKLNVLFLTSWYPNKNHPTLGNFIQRHAEALNPFVNLKVLHICSDNNQSNSFEVENKIIQDVDTTIVYYKKVSKYSILNSIVKLFRYKKALKLGLKTINESFFPDLAHVHVSYPAGISAQWLLQKQNIPYVISEHWTLFLKDETYKSFNFLIRKSIEKTLNKASYILPVSESLSNKLQKITTNKDFQIINNVVNTDIFTPRLNSNEKTTILHVSHMDDEHKNAYGMLKAIKNVSLKRNDFIFKIVSDENHEKTKQIIRDLNIDSEIIQLEHTKTSNQIAHDFNSADFFVIFSNIETFSVVMAEAWSAGLPIVYSKCGGLTDINNDKLGIQVEIKNIEQLENAIITMLDNYESYDKSYISDFAHSKFNKNEIANQFIDVYNKVLKK
jgi:glycosyltransferase involved in cell wall biosynthesis